MENDCCIQTHTLGIMTANQPTTSNYLQVSARTLQVGGKETATRSFWCSPNLAATYRKGVCAPVITEKDIFEQANRNMACETRARRRELEVAEPRLPDLVLSTTFIATRQPSQSYHSWQSWYDRRAFARDV
jgi:hypothetical protein